MPTFHARLDRLAFSLSRCPKIRSRRNLVRLVDRLAARRFGSRAMSEHEALARFHDWYAARRRKAETRWLWRRRCVMHAQRSPLTKVLIRSASCAEGEFILRHRPLTNRIVKEI
jgi:hypothetical protein